MQLLVLLATIPGASLSYNLFATILLACHSRMHKVNFRILWGGGRQRNARTQFLLSWLLSTWPYLQHLPHLREFGAIWRICSQWVVKLGDPVCGGARSRIFLLATYLGIFHLAARVILTILCPTPAVSGIGFSP